MISPTASNQAVAFTPGGGRVGRLAEGAFDGLLADVAARRLSTGRRIAHQVTEIEAPLCGMPVGTPVEFLIVPADQLPSDIWPVLLAHRPVGILAGVRDGRVAVGPGRPQTGPMRVVIALLASALVPALLVGAAPSAGAAPDLSGRWVSDSLRDNRIGYYLVLRAAPEGTAGYVGHLRFERQSGERGARMPLSATVVGDRVILTARDGRFDKAGRTITARLDGRGTLALTNCLDRLQQVMSWDLASDCTLRLQS